MLRRLHRGRRGATLLEMMITSIVLTLFVTELSSVWNSFNKQLNVALDRASINREARTARALFLSDLSGAAAVIVDAPGTLRMRYDPDPTQITYTLSSGFLVRSNITASTTMSAAKYVQSVAFSNPDSDSLVLASLVFSKGSASTTLNLYQIFVSTM